MLVNVKITDGSISTHLAMPAVKELRDTDQRTLKLKISSKRTRGYWYVWFKKWHKVGEWPLIKTRDIRQDLDRIRIELANNNNKSVSANKFETCGDLITWYESRIVEDANLSDKRKNDVLSVIKCHLMPRLGEVPIDKLERNTLDKELIWPLQKVLSKSTISGVFQKLKAAFRRATKLQLIKLNPLSDIAIGDFGDFTPSKKGSKLKPVLVMALLDEMEEELPLFKMLVMMMLTLGTRIGETRKAKWSDITFGGQPEWLIPEDNTKTRKLHNIQLPNDLVNMLKQWRDYQLSRHYKGKYVFPNKSESGELTADEATKLIHGFSGGEFTSHDLRKCARICWAEQSTDYMVGERMLNHSVGKVAEAYLDSKVISLRKKALERHCSWLKTQNKNCFIVDIKVIQGNKEEQQKTSDSVA